MKRIDLGAGSFSYIDAGTSSDLPIVLLHAMGRSAADWDPIIKHLQDDFRVLAFDMRGHGNSCRPGEYSFELMRDDLLGFVDALELKRFRDQHCQHPGCDRPHRWCDAHHLTHWADGGPTSLNNLVLLCRRHHRATHEGEIKPPTLE